MFCGKKYHVPVKRSVLGAYRSTSGAKMRQTGVLCVVSIGAAATKTLLVPGT